MAGAQRPGCPRLLPGQDRRTDSGRRRPLLRAAVVGGGAYVAGKHMANKANEQASNEAYQNQRIDQLEQQQQPQYQDQQQYAPPPQQAPPPDAAPAAGPSMADQLQQ